MELYLNYGEEDFLRNYNTEKIVKDNELKNPSINLVRINESNINTLIENCEQMPFFDDKKIIIVKNSGLFASGSKKINEDQVNRVIEYILNLPDYIIMAFNEESVDKRISAYKKISKVAKVKEYTYQTITDLANWICRGMKALDAEIDMKTAEYLAEVCGPSMSYLHTEVQKLAALIKEGKKVNIELIDDACMKSEQGIIFDLTDSVGERNVKKALELVNDLILKKQAEQYILIMLYKHIRNMYIIKVAQEEGRSSAAELGINPYVFSKVTRQLKNFTDSDIKNMLNNLIELDFNSKSGNINIRVGLECFISSLSI
jgi:DNA polymerase-3 subunit delta